MKKIEWNRTDLIDEAEEVVIHQTKQQKEKLKDSSGILIEESQENRVKITKVTVDEKGEKQIGKKKGTYVTLSVPTLTPDDKDGFSQLEAALEHHLEEMHRDIVFTKDQKVLVIGLGNKTITPDAIGPFTIDSMHKLQSELESPQFVLYAPGVTGQTGFETSDFIAALTDKIKPALVIVIDALATSGSARLCRTIQLTNTGIHPGSGVGNQRAEVSKEAIGVPVTAIGIPTVVEAPILIADAIDVVFRSIAAQIEERGKPSRKLSVKPWTPSTESVDLELIKPIFGEWSTWTTEDRRQLFEEVFSSHPERLIVSPKEVDIWLIQYALLLSNCLFKWIKTAEDTF
ncbi:GPR endopeptidase [Solibacillus sp. FSL H8-0538]|uniref:GPR endopeptidase n=1 Tax=Solibacillus sp. FSL H8-0538 TaxID=2921400 RepID=UPI0030F9FBE5